MCTKPLDGILVDTRVDPMQPVVAKKGESGEWLSWDAVKGAWVPAHELIEDLKKFERRSK